MTRIETLIPYKESDWKPTARLGKLNTQASPHAISAKLGRYLTKNLTPENRRQLAQTLAETIIGQTVEPYTPEPGTLKAKLAEDMTNPTAFITEDGTVVYAADNMPDRKKGLSQWRWKRRHIGEREQFKALGFRIDTAVGALDILTDDATPDDDYYRTRLNIVRRIIMENRHALDQEDWAAFMLYAIIRWNGEENRESNRRFAAAHNAGVFTDKKHCDERHRAAAEGSAFSMFRHVEIDDDIDLNLFHDLDAEFGKRWEAGELPRIGMGNAFRFRKTGRHKAIGVYSANLKAIAVDPRAPRSLLHEFAHAYDFEHGQLSCGEMFAPILRDYRNGIDLSGMSESRRKYALAPTEVFARAWEVYAQMKGVGGSFVGTGETYGADPLYTPLLSIDVARFFERIA